MPDFGYGFEPFDYNTFLLDMYARLVQMEKVYAGKEKEASENVISIFSDEYLAKVNKMDIPNLARIHYGNAYDEMRAHNRRLRLVSMTRKDILNRAQSSNESRRTYLLKKYSKVNKDLSEIMSDSVLGSIRPDVWSEVKSIFDLSVQNKKGLEKEIRKIGIPEDVPITPRHIADYYASKGVANARIK